VDALFPDKPEEILNMKKQKPIWAILFAVLLIGWTVYVMLDVFVIQRTFQDNATEMNLSMFTSVAPTPSPTATPTPVELVKLDPDVTPTPAPTSTPTPTPTPSHFSDTVIETEIYYVNDHLSVTLSDYREHNTDIHVAEVWVSSAQYIYTAFAKDKFGRNIEQKPSVMAKNKDAVLAINGDNYGSREGGYVIRNGVLYRAKKYEQTSRDVLCIMPDGDFYFTAYDKDKAEDLVARGTWQALTFGPVLVDNSEIKVGVYEEVKLAFAKNPRTAIGMVEPLHYFIVTADGRTDWSPGISLYQLADFMKRLGCTKVYNLDGGGSSTMWFRGRVVNFPTSYGTYLEKEVTDIVYLR